MDKMIKGISCEVKNCVYHDKSNNCNAGHIKVGTTMANTVSETNCETFEKCETGNCCK